MKNAAPKFQYQWQQNIAKLGRRKRATTDEEGVNTFLEVRQLFTRVMNSTREFSVNLLG